MSHLFHSKFLNLITQHQARQQIDTKNLQLRQTLGKLQHQIDTQFKTYLNGHKTDIENDINSLIKKAIKNNHNNFEIDKVVNKYQQTFIKQVTKSHDFKQYQNVAIQIAHDTVTNYITNSLKNAGYQIIYKPVNNSHKDFELIANIK